MSALRAKEFWAILLASIVGVLDLWSWVVLGLLAVLLTLWSVVSDPHWLGEFRRVGRLDALALFWLGCLAQNAGFVGLAYAVGRLTRWLWF